MMGLVVMSTELVVQVDGQFVTVATLVELSTLIVVVPEQVAPWLVASVSSAELSVGSEIVGAFGTGVPLIVALPQLFPEQILEGLVPGAALSILSLELRPNVGEPRIRYWSCVYIGPLITSPLTQLMLHWLFRPAR